MNIAVTDTMGSEAKFQSYADWLRSGNAGVNIIKLSYADDNLKMLEQCAGVVLTGGGDVHPRLYGGDPHHPRVYGVDAKRDDFERAVIDRALRNSMPFLGICRGLQLTNVHLGGTLITDLEDAGYPPHTRKGDPELRHPVTLMEQSVISRMAGSGSGNVNSYHHQAANQPGAGLRITGVSDDGVAEAIEPLPGTFTSFFMMIQWHPERMKDTENPLCASILESFISATGQQ